MEEHSGHFLLGIWQVFGRGLFLVAGSEGQVIYMYVGYVPGQKVTSPRSQGQRAGGSGGCESARDEVA